MLVTAIAIVGLACAATWNVACAASVAGKAAQADTQQAATTPSKTKKKTKRSKIERAPTNWLNPQPEPPLPAGNWSKPEPPRPDASKKLH
jgi:hypothetical protein